MPIRERIRRVFTRSSDDSSRSTKSSVKSSKKDSSIYQPGEKMPPLKYRRPVNPEHKAALESFSWAKAWRRNSEQSVYSPMGSRMPSRKTSHSTIGRRSIGGRSSITGGWRGTERGGDGEGSGSAVDSGIGVGVGVGSDQVKEGSDEEHNVSNGRNLPQSLPRANKSSSRSLSSSHSFAIAFQPPHLISCTALPFSQVRFLVETSIGPTLYTRRPRSRPQTLASGNSERRTRERRQRWSQSKGRGTTGLKTGSSMAMAMFVQYNWAEPLIHDFDSCSYIQHHRLFSLQFLYWLVISVSINHHDVYVIYTDCIPGERGRV